MRREQPGLAAGRTQLPPVAPDQLGGRAVGAFRLGQVPGNQVRLRQRGGQPVIGGPTCRPYPLQSLQTDLLDPLCQFPPGRRFAAQHLNGSGIDPAIGRVSGVGVFSVKLERSFGVRKTRAVLFE